MIQPTTIEGDGELASEIAKARASKKVAVNAMTRHADLIRDLLMWQLVLMYEYSEDKWAAGWMTGLAQEVWHSGDPLARNVREIAEITDVWYIADKYPVPLADWKIGRYDKEIEA